MEKITAFKTKDGKVFVDKELAEKHERGLIMENKIKTLFNTLDVFHIDEATFFENWSEIEKIFK